MSWYVEIGLDAMTSKTFFDYMNCNPRTSLNRSFRCTLVFTVLLAYNYHSKLEVPLTKSKGIIKLLNKLLVISLILT